MNAWAVAIASNVIWPFITVLVNWRKDNATVDKAKADAAAVIQETSASLVTQVRDELEEVRKSHQRQIDQLRRDHDAAIANVKRQNMDLLAFIHQTRKNVEAGIEPPWRTLPFDS